MSARSFVVRLFIGCAVLCGSAEAVRAALTAQDKPPSLADPNSIDMQQYQISNARIPGRNSARQTVTAWQVKDGTWNGQQLSGLSLVLVRSTSDDGSGVSTTNCYVSQSATPAQRNALVQAFLATQSYLLSRMEVASMRIEPAVITFEFVGRAIIFHLGLVA